MDYLILIRHGQTEKNAAGQLHEMEDIEQLNDVGIRQIKKTAEKLKEFSPIKVYASRERRAIQSGELIAKELDAEFEAVNEMQERNWGDFSGRPWKEVQKILEQMTLEERYTYVPPKGESWEQFEKRLIATINTLIAQSKNKTIVVVSHGGAIRALMPYLLGAPKEESFKHNPDNASITVFNKKDGFLKLISANDTTHLKDLK